ncbi:MAG: ornithine carbamoyltransferase [Gammaproteobacteria bacterium]|nr:ornithine carbamoyltransferase [Gammaproteobacteria bacterium]
MRGSHTVRHFLSLCDLAPAELDYLIRRARVLKAMRAAGSVYEPLRNRTLGMVFEKSSTRTRVAFEVAMADFGGQAIFLSPHDTQLGRGEPIEDTARVLSRMVDIIMVRTFEHEKIQTFARYSRVPVINGLTDMFHPCQLLADVLTFVEHRGELRGRRVAWVGDGNNMCHSYVNAAMLLGFELRIACPQGYAPAPAVLATAAANVTLCHDPRQAVRDADLVVTDVWASMGQEGESNARMAAFRPFQVDEELFALAGSDALFMHCLPAHRGEEVTVGVMDHARSVVWDEAENRLHAQKALIELLLCGVQ